MKKLKVSVDKMSCFPLHNLIFPSVYLLKSPNKKKKEKKKNQVIQDENINKPICQILKEILA